MEQFQQTIFIDDNGSPEITCSATTQIPGCSIAALQENGDFPFSNGITVISSEDFITTGGIIEDDCGIREIWYRDVQSGSCPVIVTRTYTAIDFCMNQVTCVRIYHIQDLEAPEFDVPADLTLSKDVNCTYDASVSITGSPTNLSDDCTPIENLQVSYSDVETPGSCEGSVILLRTWIVTDACGNSTEKIQTIHVNDNTLAPTFTAPVNITIYKNAHCEQDASASITGEPTDLWDNCTSPENLVLTFNDVMVPGDCIGDLVIQRTWILTDDCGNSSSQVQIITVEDNTPPVLVIPDDAGFEACSVNELEDLTGLPYRNTATDITNLPNLADLGIFISDNCQIKSLTYRDVSGISYPLEIYRVFILTDECGNWVTAEQVITLSDASPPEFPGVPNALEYCVENLFIAKYLNNTLNLDPHIPDYYLFRQGNTDFDFDMSKLTDNCCDDPEEFTIRWDILTVGESEPFASGTGQPSGYTGNIQIPGDGVAYKNVTHIIRYWITDCHDNEVPFPIERQIVITPRPQINSNME
jgi:hypothetical protein